MFEDLRHRYSSTWTTLKNKRAGAVKMQIGKVSLELGEILDKVVRKVPTFNTWHRQVAQIEESQKNKNNENGASTALDEGGKAGNVEFSNCFRYGKIHRIQEVPTTEKRSDDVFLYPVTSRKVESSGNEEERSNLENYCKTIEVIISSGFISKEYVHSTSVAYRMLRKYPDLVSTMLESYEEGKKKEGKQALLGCGYKGRMSKPTLN
eukprot:augustus_masked-scaffold_111-processed-gene-0.11-mRNA-1 protein AED:1.00 eAED:1.00 QI:0/0/0/0/1/1/2/0/206